MKTRRAYDDIAFVHQRSGISIRLCRHRHPGAERASLPPHKHDTDNHPHEAIYEEVYFFSVKPAGGFGMQRIYERHNGDDALDIAFVVEDGDTVTIPRGYHPVVAAPAISWAMSGRCVGEGARMARGAMIRPMPGCVMSSQCWRRADPGIAVANTDILMQHPLENADGEEADSMAFARQSRHHSILSARTYVRISGIGFVATRSVTRLPFVTSASGNDARLDASLRDKLGTPTYFDAHTNLATLGEFCHDGNHAVNDMIAVMLGNTITADIIMNGKLHHGGAGAIGHMALDPTGVQCHCGQRGCLETSAGTAAIIATAQSQGSAAITLAQVIAAANHGDAGCIAALERAGIALGTALANVVVMLNPGMIVLGGATMMAGDLLLTPARQVLLRHPRLAHKPQVRIVPIILGSRADAIDTRVPS